MWRRLKVRHFGTLGSGIEVEQYTLRAERAECDVLTYGGALRALRVPDRDGRPVDILLGFDRLEDYVAHTAYMGALVGRHANRVGGGQVRLDGRTYALPLNDKGRHHLHGGHRGFDRMVWMVEEAYEHQIILSLFSEDGEEGYPANMSIRVTYTLSPDSLRVDCWARSDRTTLCNLTSHGYFNLHGHHSGPVGGQRIQIFADSYTPADQESIPYGTLAAVEGTPMDLRESTALGDRWDADFDQLRWAGGFDHNWAVRGEMGVLRPAARAYGPETGITLEMSTTLPGVQLYTGNGLEGCPAGKGGAPYGRRWGFCLEGQFYPNNPNCPDFPQAILRRGETWRQTTVYQFG